MSLPPGPVFTNLLLADEINRTPPKTQAALLEAMGEGQVSVDGITHRLSQPFVVLATDNPIEYEGTYPLPEAQLDRFTARIRVGYLDSAGEEEMARRLLDRGSAPPQPRQVADAATLLAMGESLERVHLDRDVLGLYREPGRRYPRAPEGHRRRQPAWHPVGDPAIPRPRGAGSATTSRPRMLSPLPSRPWRTGWRWAGDVGPAGDRRGPCQRDPRRPAGAQGRLTTAHPVTWRAGARLRRLATIALLAMAAAAVTGHGDLLLLAAPALAALAMTGRRGAPAKLALKATVAVSRCYEGEDIEAHGFPRFTASSGRDHVQLRSGRHRCGRLRHDHPGHSRRYQRRGEVGTAARGVGAPHSRPGPGPLPLRQCLAGEPQDAGGT